MFRPYKVILRPSKKTDPRDVYVSMHCGIPNAYKFSTSLTKNCEHLESLNAMKHKQLLDLSSWRA